MVAAAHIGVGKPDFVVPRWVVELVGEEILHFEGTIMLARPIFSTFPSAYFFYEQDDASSSGRSSIYLFGRSYDPDGNVRRIAPRAPSTGEVRRTPVLPTVPVVCNISLQQVLQ